MGIEYGVASVAVDELVVAVEMFPVVIEPKLIRSHNITSNDREVGEIIGVPTSPDGRRGAAFSNRPRNGLGLLYEMGTPKAGLNLGVSFGKKA